MGFLRFDLILIDLLVIQNEEGTVGSVMSPLPRESLLKIIEIAYDGAKDGDCFEIFPGESLRIQPRTPKNLCIRCSAGTASYHLFVIPR